MSRSRQRRWLTRRSARGGGPYPWGGVRPPRGGVHAVDALGLHGATVDACEDDANGEPKASTVATDVTGDDTGAGEAGEEGTVSVRWLDTTLPGASVSTRGTSTNSASDDICIVTASTINGWENFRPDRSHGSGEANAAADTVTLRRCRGGSSTSSPVESLRFERGEPVPSFLRWRTDSSASSPVESLRFERWVDGELYVTQLE
ncbi:hypothetical protein PF007_g8265 [Phytophthora fragariae]|nr:hypothetical protein PF003_g15214 [Phytophthora fragariae]KAE9120211.1 hypothetical protein PF007_g8265 [Phytophthora fragariae]